MSLGLTGWASVAPAGLWLWAFTWGLPRRFNSPRGDDSTPHHVDPPPPAPPAAEPGRDSPRAAWFAATALIATAATAFIAPMFFSGTLPPGDDLSFALQLVRNVAEGLGAGDAWPRWVDDMNAGLGGPALVVYAPMSAWLGGSLVFASGDLVSGLQLASWLGAFFAGAAFLFAVRPWCGLPSAVGAAAFYVLAPYHFVDQYPRFAFAETLAFVFVPLVFRFARTIIVEFGGAEATPGAEHQRRPTAERLIPPLGGFAVALGGFAVAPGGFAVALVGFAGAFAGLILTHALTAVLTVIALGLYAAVAMWSTPLRTSATQLGVLAAGGLLALLLAAFQLAPMFAERPNLQAHRLVSVEHGALARNFLFRDETALGFTRSNIKPIVESATVPTALLAFATASIAWRRRRAGTRLANAPIGRESLAMGVVAAGVLLLQLPISAPLWRALPFLESLQFPWRFGVLLAFATAWLLACALESWPSDEAAGPLSKSKSLERGIVATLAAWAVLTGFQIAALREAPANPRWIDDPNLRGRVVPEYLPPDVTAEDVVLHARSRRNVAWASAPARIDVLEWSPGKRAFSVTVEEPVDLVVATFSNPRWVATVDGQAVGHQSTRPLQLLRLPLAAGQHDVRLRFGHGPADGIGAAASVIGLTLCGGLLIWKRRLGTKP